jgi:hypothetical protein
MVSGASTCAARAADADDCDDCDDRDDDDDDDGPRRAASGERSADCCEDEVADDASAGEEGAVAVRLESEMGRCNGKQDEKHRLEKT